MKHLRLFPNVTVRDSVLADIDYPVLHSTDGVGLGIRHGGVVPPTPSYSEPFYIDVRGPVTLAATSGLQMSTDGENWTDTVAGDLPTGKTYFRVASDQTTPLKPNWAENDDSDYDIGGNINSLVKTSFENDTTCYDFGACFANKAKLKSAGSLILPATTLAEECYVEMFYGCTSLTTAPELPATTLAEYCYDSMFCGCTSLTTAPELPAPILVANCYCYMFQSCTSLNEITIYANDISADDCLIYWVQNVASEGTFNNMGSAIYPSGQNGNPWDEGPGPTLA